jgi:hypothetical protein
MIYLVKGYRMIEGRIYASFEQKVKSYAEARKISLELYSNGFSYVDIESNDLKEYQ